VNRRHAALFHLGTPRHDATGPKVIEGIAGITRDAHRSERIDRAASPCRLHS
jgi:hypothetical protein